MSPLSSMKRPTHAHARRVYADYRRRFPKAGKAQLELARENIFEFGHPDPLFGTEIPSPWTGILKLLRDEPDDGIEYHWFEKEPRVSTRREQLRRKLPWFLGRWNTTFHLLPPVFVTAIPRRYRYKASARKMSRICGLTP